MPLRITPSHKAVYEPSSDAAPDFSDLSELSEDDHLDSEDDALLDHNGYEIGPAIATTQLSIHHYNVKEWDTRDAYRELYKFWKQTIVKSFAVEDTFHHEHEETRNWITVKALIPTWPGYMGFIRYSKTTGTITFINADALLLQSTDNNHTPETENFTNDTTFFFRFQNERLKAPTTPTTTPYQPRPAHDLTVTITSSHPQFPLLPPHTFRTWLRVSLHLTPKPPSANIIPTPHGDILLDPEFSGTLYLRGILLPELSFDRCRYKYGYNLHYGIPTTSGRRLASPLHEVDLICSVWGAAICSAPVYVLPRFVDMVFGGVPWPVEVMWADGGGMAAEAVEAVWWSLLVRGGEGVFYYCGARGEEEAGEIRRLLGKKPVAIPSGLWDALRRLRLIRTVWEERDGRARK
ncbi:AIG2-like family protein [Aspergillus niger]|uniref:AIG2-like family protein n=2 Tax=Aspergillus niger TaxID=5061 RepID=A0A505I6C0_ASPNG|nr:AIG2-like family protein [Aspergillus niger]